MTGLKKSVSSLEETYLRVLTYLARLYSEGGQHSRAIEMLEKYISAEPYQDDAYCQLIEQHLAMNDNVSASRIYKKFTETIATGPDFHSSSRMRALRTRLGSSRQN